MSSTNLEKLYFEELRDETFKRATADSMEIVLPTPAQIQLDIDSPWPAGPLRVQAGSAGHRSDALKLQNYVDCNIKLLDRLIIEIGIVDWSAWRSRNGNTHVMLTLGRELPPAERIALQAILGSDPMRELLNLRRVLCGAEDPIALFRPPRVEGRE